MPTRTRSIRRRIVLLAALHLTVAAVVGGAAAGAGLLGPVSGAVVPFAVAVAVLGSVRMHVELGRHAVSVTMVEAVVVGMLLHLSPAGVVVAAALGEALVCAWLRQSPVKLAYNVGSTSTAALLAALVFVGLRAEGAGDGTTWAAALAAAGAYATLTHASTSLALGAVEGSPFTRVFRASLAPVAIASVISASLGLVAVVLGSVTPVAVLLVAPLVLVMVAEARRLAAHRAEHLRFERLYAASSRTGGLTGLAEVMARLGDEARSLVTGAAGLCCTAGPDGVWTGVVVGDGGPAPAPGAAVDAVVALAGPGSAAELPERAVPGAVQALEPSAGSLVVARSDAGAAAPVVLAVLRQLSGDEGSGARAEVLAAFLGHASLALANARLYADVEAALAHQVDLNRQKDDFVSAVSHELRTPLAATIGSVLTLRRMDERLSAEQRSTLMDLACRQAKRLQRLIEELLTLATVESGDQPWRSTPVDVGRMVDDIADELRAQRAGEEPAPIRFHGDGSAIVHTSEPKLRQVLSNLVENACKYAPGSPVDVVLRADGEWSRIEVVDGGPGIPVADRERVFERFVQLDQTSTRSRGGTGLGLYLCRQVAGLLGGSLTLGDSPGGGCRFVLALPSQPADRAERPVAPEGPQLATTTTGGDRP
ncbi:MAG: sensor histidine kinase [Acidimicrobiia bacterium]